MSFAFGDIIQFPQEPPVVSLRTGLNHLSDLLPGSMSKMNPVHLVLLFFLRIE